MRKPQGSSVLNQAHNSRPVPRGPAPESAGNLTIHRPSAVRSSEVSRCCPFEFRVEEQSSQRTPAPGRAQPHYPTRVRRPQPSCRY